MTYSAPALTNTSLVPGQLTNTSSIIYAGTEETKLKELNLGQQKRTLASNGFGRGAKSGMSIFPISLSIIL